MVEVVLTPDRLLLICEDQEDDLGRHGFMVHMLDEENTVITSILTILPDKKNCERRIQKTKRILRKAKTVYVGNWSNLTKKPRVENRNRSYIFPGHGTFYSNGRSLQFAVFVNDRGECYNPMAHDHEPCLDYPFPLEKYEKEVNERSKK